MTRLRRIFAGVAIALVVAPLVANAPLFDPDEGLHAAIAQEMNLRGDYVTPTFLGEPFLDKPILFFWAEAASLRVLGDREAAVRLPPLLFGLLGMIGVAALGRTLFDEQAGLVAGMVYGTMLLPLGVSEVAVHDVAVVPFMCAACAGLVRSFRLKAETTETKPVASAETKPAASAETKPAASAETKPVASAETKPAASAETKPVASAKTKPVASAETKPVASAKTKPVASAFRRNVYGALLAGVALGLSILTKGLVGVVFAGILGACLAAHTPKAIGRLAVFLAIAGAVAILVALPWYVAMERAHPGYLHYYFVERHLQGYLTATQRHAGRGWWYYVPIVIGGTLPWTGYLADAVKEARSNRLRLVTWAWFLAGLVFLSAGESKLVTYALPLFPALAILAGERIVSGGTFAGRFSYGLFAATLAILPIGALGGVAIKFGGVSVRHWLIVSLASLAIAVVAVRARPGRSAPLQDAAAIAMRLPVMALAGLMIVAPLAAAWMTARDLAASLNAAGALPPHVSVLDERIGSLVFYLAPPLRAAAAPDRLDESAIAQVVSRIRVEPEDAVLAVRDDQVPRFSRLFATPPVPVSHAGTFTVFRAGDLRPALLVR